MGKIEAVMTSYGYYDAIIPLLYSSPNVSLGGIWIFWKRVNIDEVNMTRAFRKARCGTKEDLSLLFIFLHFHVYHNDYDTKISKVG